MQETLELGKITVFYAFNPDTNILRSVRKGEWKRKEVIFILKGTCEQLRLFEEDLRKNLTSNSNE